MMMIRLAPVALLMTLLVPPAIYVATGTSSMTVGVLLCALAWLLISLATSKKPYVVKKSEVYSLAVVLGLLLLLTVHVAISSRLVDGVDFGRFFISCIILAAVVMSARFAAKRLESVPDKHLLKAADLVLAVLTLLGVAAALGVPAIGSQATGKPVVVFPEPSQFALAYVPVLMFRVATAKASTQALLACMALGIALLLQSLTMVAGVMMIVALLLRRTPLVLMTLAVAVGLLTLDLTYYTSRLMFTSDTDNLSTLVLMQGWEQAILAFQASSGMGVGFQQFGIAGPLGEIAEKIAQIMGGTYLNLRDGGATASKLIGEFGMFGIIGLLFFLKTAAQGALYVRRAQRQRPQLRDVRTLFYYSLVVAYAVELFLRGSGYFSAGAFLTLVALLSLGSRTAASRGLLPSVSTTGTTAKHIDNMDRRYSESEATKSSTPVA